MQSRSRFGLKLASGTGRSTFTKYDRSKHLNIHVPHPHSNHISATRCINLLLSLHTPTLGASASGLLAVCRQNVDQLRRAGAHDSAHPYPQDPCALSRKVPAHHTHTRAAQCRTEKEPCNGSGRSPAIAYQFNPGRARTSESNLLPRSAAHGAQ